MTMIMMLTCVSVHLLNRCCYSISGYTVVCDLPKIFGVFSLVTRLTQGSCVELRMMAAVVLMVIMLCKQMIDVTFGKA